jgi:hypothetical protein
VLGPQPEISAYDPDSITLEAALASNRARATHFTGEQLFQISNLEVERKHLARMEAKQNEQQPVA